MEVSTNLSISTPIKFTGERHSGRDESLKQHVSDNPGTVVLTGGAATVASGGFLKFSKIVSNLTKTTSAVRAQKASQFIDVIGKLLRGTKFAGFATNPIVKGFAGVFGGAAAAVTVITSAANVCDTYGYLSDMGKAA